MTARGCALVNMIRFRTYITIMEESVSIDLKQQALLLSQAAAMCAHADFGRETAGPGQVPGPFSLVRGRGHPQPSLLSQGPRNRRRRTHRRCAQGTDPWMTTSSRPSSVLSRRQLKRNSTHGTSLLWVLLISPVRVDQSILFFLVCSKGSYQRLIPKVHTSTKRSYQRFIPRVHTKGSYQGFKGFIQSAFD